MELISLDAMYAALHVFMICLCNENKLSKIIPRFPSDLLNSIGMPLIFKDVDKGDRYVYSVAINIVFVLSWFI